MFSRTIPKFRSFIWLCCLIGYTQEGMEWIKYGGTRTFLIGQKSLCQVLFYQNQRAGGMRVFQNISKCFVPPPHFSYPSQFFFVPFRSFFLPCIELITCIELMRAYTTAEYITRKRHASRSCSSKFPEKFKTMVNIYEFLCSTDFSKCWHEVGQWW